MQKNNKGNMALGTALVLGFVVFTTMGTIGALIGQNVQDTTTVNTAARNVTVKTLEGYNNFASLLPLVGTVIIAAVVLAIVVTLFARRQ